MIDLQTYKQIAMDLIINENQRLIIESPDNDVALWNGVNEIQAAMWNMYWAFVESLPENFDTNRYPSPMYFIHSGSVMCDVRYDNSKRLTVEWSQKYGLVYIGYFINPVIGVAFGELDGANPRADLLHWLVS